MALQPTTIGNLDFSELKLFLDEKADFYNNPSFIDADPIQIPHRFSLKQDQEIAAFLTATIAWGNRKSIIKDADKMLTIMGNSPYDFVKTVSENQLRFLDNSAIHRTFSGEDFRTFILNLQRLYQSQDSLEHFFKLKPDEKNFYHALDRFRTNFLGDKIHRSSKHVSATYKNSAAKRLMMFLRWMVRNDQRGVDLGIWKNTDPKFLSVPLDVHSGNIARKLQLIERKQNDWKTVEEMDRILRTFDAQDPAKYDFALFGLGVSGDF